MDTANLVFIDICSIDAWPAMIISGKISMGAAQIIASYHIGGALGIIPQIVQWPNAGKSLAGT